VDALEDEIEHLMHGFESHEMPFPRTKDNIAKFKANLKELDRKLQIARKTLTTRRAANPLPED
jgi:hypothetical protein